MIEQATGRVPSGARGSGFRQDVLTPRYIWQQVLGALGRDRFDVDLFTDARTMRNVPSASNIIWPTQDAKTADWAPAEAGPRLWCAWGNPPFSSMRWVLARAAAMRWDHAELILLVPLRPHRKYWPPAYSSNLQVDLPAVTFEGEENTFSLPCVLLYWGPRPNAVRSGLAELGVVSRDEPLTASACGDTLLAMNHAELNLARLMLDAALDISNVPSLGQRALLLVPGTGAALIRLIVLYEGDGAAYHSPGNQAQKALRIASESLGAALALAHYMTTRGGALDDAIADALNPASTPAKAPAVVRSKPEKKTPPRVVPPVAEPKPAPASAANADPGVGAVPAVSASAVDALAAYVSGMAVGETFQTGTIIALTTGSRASVVRACSANAQVEQRGRGRGAKWERVS